jgi:hypothetical protein
MKKPFSATKSVRWLTPTPFQAVYATAAAERAVSQSGGVPMSVPAAISN